jgi:ATP-dependent Clp protease ATP-binding subunit ClpC
VFKRFTDEARQVVVKAQDEARTLGHHHIGAEHLLLGVLAHEEGIGARILAEAGVTAAEVRSRIAAGGESAPPGQIPFTPEAKRVLELSLREALTVGHNYIGTEHIVLALGRLKGGEAARILSELGASAERLDDAFVRLVRAEVRAFTRGRRGRWRPGMSGFGVHSVPACWEYRIERRPELTEADAEWLNTLGADGWELCAVVPSADRGTLVFRRHKPIGFRATGT